MIQFYQQSSYVVIICRNRTITLKKKKIVSVLSHHNFICIKPDMLMSSLNVLEKWRVLYNFNHIKHFDRCRIQSGKRLFHENWTPTKYNESAVYDKNKHCIRDVRINWSMKSSHLSIEKRHQDPGAGFRIPLLYYVFLFPENTLGCISYSESFS